jgi:hypothetical protein
MRWVVFLHRNWEFLLLGLLRKLESLLQLLHIQIVPHRQLTLFYIRIKRFRKGIKVLIDLIRWSSGNPPIEAGGLVLYTFSLSTPQQRPSDTSMSWQRRDYGLS